MRAQRGPSLSLRHLLILLTAIGLLPLAALGAWSVHLAAEYHENEQERALLDLARAGSAILVISQDLDEIFEIADRIAVISRGQLSQAYLASELTREKIGLLMAGEHEVKEERHAARA